MSSTHDRWRRAHRMGEAHDLLENRRSYALHGKVAIDVAGDTVALPPRAA
ncbi:hypothetical protein [Mycolicibacterium parafortuitum]|nr:hypothetical protein [Mycolicibacterium parafortuitum]